MWHPSITYIYHTPLWQRDFILDIIIDVPDTYGDI